jgi:hypothetical protein
MKNMANLDKVNVPNDSQKRKLWLILMQLVPVGYVRNYEDWRGGTCLYGIAVRR